MTTIPYRYDLNYNSSLKELIKNANTVVMQIASDSQNAKVVDLWLIERRYHTRHGLYLNRKGKKFIWQ